MNKPLCKNLQNIDRNIWCILSAIEVSKWWQNFHFWAVHENNTKILSFAHSQVVPNLYEFLWKYIGNQTVDSSHWLFDHCIFSILWLSMAIGNCLVTNILQNIFFCVQQKKKTHTGLRVNKLWENFHFPFNDWWVALASISICTPC